MADHDRAAAMGRPPGGGGQGELRFESRETARLHVIAGELERQADWYDRLRRIVLAILAGV